MLVHSFPPIARSDARCLILGSMPGKASLIAQQYYAHPRNLFWNFIEEIFAIERAEVYAKRCEQLLQQKIAVWDVLRSCTRSSSLDSDIVESTIVVNDFNTFLAEHPQIHTICFNGAKAEQAFKRYAVTGLMPHSHELNLVRLPSTSPANASITLASKLAAWRSALSGEIMTIKRRD